MKITAVEAVPVWGGHHNFLFVVVETDEGVTGVGEAGLTGREHAVIGALRHFEPLLAGQDPFRTEHLWQTLSRGGFFPAGLALSAALSAIDIALWDIKGKALGVPVYELLGGRVRDRVACYPHNVGGGEDLAALVASCERTVAEGWRFVRWGMPSRGEVFEPGWAVRAALRELEAVRAALGDEIEICFDVHTRLDPSDAVTFCREAEAFRPYFIEDPLRSESTDAYRMLRARTGVPLAAGEQLGSKWAFRQLIEEDLIDYCRLDICLVGGFTEARKIAGWCETHGIRLATHNPLGPVSTAACLHLNLATPNVGVQEQPARTSTALRDVVPVQAEWEAGYLLPPERPGLGIELDREAAHAYPFRQTEPPHLRRADGAFTNW